MTDPRVHVQESEPVSEPSWRILEGDCRERLRSLDAGSVQTCVTSPPYFGLRDYGHDGQIGLEPTPDEFVAALVEVFRAVRRVLRNDGTVWLNLGDSYFPEKQLCGVPWRVALALQSDGWYLRSDIIWHKPNPMPEGTAYDRPSRAHDYLFLLSKSPRYFYDADAIRETWADERNGASGATVSKFADAAAQRKDGGVTQPPQGDGRNRRSVWTVAPQPFPGAHFATFPPKLIEPCILAGSAPACAPCEGTGVVVPMGAPERRCYDCGGQDRSVVLDPFSGSGTTGMVALRHGRSFVGCELNPDYVRLARDRIIADSPLLNTHAEAA